MEKVIIGLLGLISMLGLVFLSVIAGTCVGAVSGAIVGYVFPGTVGLVGSALTGGLALPAWQVGAGLGFVGGYFRKVVTVKQPD